MNIWIDAQLPPSIANWINQQYENIEAKAVRELGLRHALDPEIFNEAKEQNVVVMSKDDDFIEMVDRLGPPPQIMWVTCGNTSNAKLKEILDKTLSQALELLNQGEVIVEISDK